MHLLRPPPWSRCGAGRRLRRQRLYLGFRPLRICQREALASGQFEDRAQVDTGLAGLQLDGEVTGAHRGGARRLRSRTVFGLWRLSPARRVRRQPRPCSAKVNYVRRFLGLRVTVNSVQPNSWLAGCRWLRSPRVGNRGWVRSGVASRGSGAALYHLQTESLETAKVGHILGRDGHTIGERHRRNHAVDQGATPPSRLIE